MSTSTTQKPTTRRIVGMLVGIVIIGLGIALFKQSHLGNDSISALNMRLAELLGISLGVQNLCTNILFFALQFWFGRKYIGLGTFVNGIGVGFIVTAFYDPIAAHFGPAEALGLPVQLLWVALALVVTLGATSGMALVFVRSMTVPLSAKSIRTAPPGCCAGAARRAWPAGASTATRWRSPASTRNSP